MIQAAHENTAGVNEPAWALGTYRGNRFVDWAVRFNVSKVRDRAHLGLCFPVTTRPEADRSLSGSTCSPDSSRDDQHISTQPTTRSSHTGVSASCGVVENGAPTPFTTASAATTTNR